MTLEELQNEKRIIGRQIQELQAWLSAKRGDALTAHLKAFEYHRERAEKVAQHRELSLRCARLRDEIRTRSVDRNNRLASQFYNAVCELEESGTDVGERLRDLMREFEGEESEGDDQSG